MFERLFNLEGSYAAKLIERCSKSNLCNYQIPFVYKLALDHRFAEERRRLERLFERYQAALENHPRREEIIKDKLGRFWNKEDRQHFGAYYELETFDFLERCQIPFSIEPDTSQRRRPDFCIDKPLIWVEVATVFDSEEFERAVRVIQNDHLRIESHPPIPFNPDLIEKVLDRKSRRYKGPLLIALGIHEWPINIIYPEIIQLVNEVKERIAGLLIIEREWQQQPLVRSCGYYLFGDFGDPSRIDPIIFAGNCQIIDVTRIPR